MSDQATIAPRDAVVREFSDRFGEAPPLLVRAPGRVNLIGEHTDYNDGFVLPLAIERAVWIALRARADGAVHVRSSDFAEGVRFDAMSPGRGGASWGEYLKGTAWALAESGEALTGWEGVLASDVPMGAGLSSSAALELATARAFAAVSGFEWRPAVMARLAQRAENEWVGMNCGVMDQMISAVGVAGHAVLIDCRTLDTTPVPLPAGTAVVILDTSTRRGLVDSAYNERRRQCEEAAAYFGVRALRDLTPDTLALRLDELEEVTGRRARHVVTENARTLAAAETMSDGDAETLGALMTESHASMRDDFEISSPALDAIVEAALAAEGCYGARMTGGGFAGCGVALVAREAVDGFIARVVSDYRERTGLEAKAYVTVGADGASVVADGGG